MKQQHCWPPMTLIQKYFVPEEIAEAQKWTILRLAQATVTSAIRRRNAVTSDEQSSAAPSCPPSFPACRDFSTWVSNRDIGHWIGRIFKWKTYRKPAPALLPCGRVLKQKTYREHTSLPGSQSFCASDLETYVDKLFLNFLLILKWG